MYHESFLYMHTYPFWKSNCLPEVTYNISGLCDVLTILQFSRPSFSSCITFYLVLNQCQSKGCFLPGVDQSWIWSELTSWTFKFYLGQWKVNFFFTLLLHYFSLSGFYFFLKALSLTVIFIFSQKMSRINTSGMSPFSNFYLHGGYPGRLTDFV